MKPTADLPKDAERLLDVILLAFRRKLPFGESYSEPEFLSAAKELIDAGVVRILEAPDGSMRLGLLGKDF